jgi:hypothetical protein
MKRVSLRKAKETGQSRTLPRAWIAQGQADSNGYQLQSQEQAALFIYAVSVRDSLSGKVEERLRLLDDVRKRFAQEVPARIASLWVFPGGYFGFSAARGKWGYLDVQARRHLEREFIKLARHFPAPSLIAVGVDSRSGTESGEVTQQVWVAERHENVINVSRVTRAHSQLVERQFTVGSTNAAFFICGEFTGSATKHNGPFCFDTDERACFLKDPARQLRGSNVLVDLAHNKVSGSISGSCGPRMVHRLQMERFSKRGVSVLTHHHLGRLSNGRPHFKHQSNWIVFRRTTWLAESAVVELM